MIALSAALALAGIYLSCYLGYWSILLLAHFLPAARSSSIGSQDTRFAIVIPAHNEEMLLPRLLESVRSQEYPPDRFDAIVVADNCSDRTAEIAGQCGGIVMARFDEVRHGKGYALQWALGRLDMDRYDAILVVDADCFISSNALMSLDGSMQSEEVVQCYSGVGNPDESWFTRLLDVSRTINNDIYSPAKRRLGLSVQLIGTGMCFATRTLRLFGWDAFTIGEDCEYYANLVRRGGTIGYNRDAKVYHQESSSLKQATSQRMRWSSGRFTVVWKHGFRLIWQGLAERNIVKFDAGLTLILPNPSLGMNLSLVCLATVLLMPSGMQSAMVAWFGLLALAQLGIFLIGVHYTKKRLSKFLAIFVAPAFLVWKLGIDVLSILGLGRKHWVRTERKL